MCGNFVVCGVLLRQPCSFFIRSMKTSLRYMQPSKAKIKYLLKIAVEASPFDCGGIAGHYSAVEELNNGIDSVAGIMSVRENLLSSRMQALLEIFTKPLRSIRARISFSSDGRRI